MPPVILKLALAATLSTLFAAIRVEPLGFAITPGPVPFNPSVPVLKIEIELAAAEVVLNVPLSMKLALFAFTVIVLLEAKTVEALIVVLPAPELLVVTAPPLRLSVPPPATVSALPALAATAMVPPVVLTVALAPAGVLSVNPEAPPSFILIAEAPVAETDAPEANVIDGD